MIPGSVLPFLFYVLFLPLTVQAQLRLPAVFGDHMVFQQKAEAPVWGWSHPGAAVTIKASWNDEEVKTRAASTGS